ncbi:putative ATPase [Arthrobacter sp. V4I6]|uniref:AAA family ATPase n=1 Tax=unclassified Arthrobacter TaxID=235627 RepID=UPI00278475F3|nr:MULTISPECIES: AAA family ATPase [unclassified Arthrobacter]MDQ0823344.1 putative ATPase [Arthrobacter sp. V1I7]MDQ0852978.1 putative ATPase [Arthrobacter sp. V4I6]
MKFNRLDVRFFRSFNYDYELKSRITNQPAPWEDTDPAWYPFVRIPLDPEITAIVGANESGKSQLLTAIKASLTGNPINRADFCRYSELYSVKTNELRLPEFGCTFELDSTDDRAGIAALEGAREFSLYRPGAAAPFLLVNGERVPLTGDELASLEAILPSYHELRTDLAVPDSVSIAELAGQPHSQLQLRKTRTEVLERLEDLVALTAETVGEAVLPALSKGTDPASVQAEARRRAEFELARQLLVDAAGIDQQAFVELQDSIKSGREGQVEAIIGAMNSAIKENLNVQRWWSQDRDFELRVEAREHELAFTILDRTGSKYSFGERSQGLRFFLSYFVQLTAHRLKNRKPDILLLDEPDAFLSSVGQQDLMRVLHDYALPEDDGQQSQVVYVTHSPFLIDKNAPHRIRVLDKGSEDEGTRVVRDAANNRYEPLRSSIGANLAETTFIGGKNLLVEGQGDQVLLAGISAHIAKREQSTAGVLDLNEVTVVACGGADGIPYMAYLARGRDVIKPPCVALLDGDKSGLIAEKVLQRGEARRKRVLRDEYIVRLDTWAAESGLVPDNGVSIIEIEDLLPIEIAHRAALNYLARFEDLQEQDTESFTPESIGKNLAKSGGRLWDALEGAYTSAFAEEHIEKAGLAREVISLLAVFPDTAGAEMLRRRFAALLSFLAERLEDASEEEDRNRSDDRMKRAVNNFLRNHPQGMRKHDAKKLMRELDSALDVSPFGDAIRPRLSYIARDYELGDLSTYNVPRFDSFREEVKALSSSERILYQDDATKDPASAVTQMISVELQRPAGTKSQAGV